MKTQDCKTQETSAFASRWRAMAGPFFSMEEALLRGVEIHLRETKARIVIQPERGGQTIYRLRSECETLADTAARLKRKKLKS